MKIIGSGLIASAFYSVDLGEDLTVFASGVSNSKEQSKSEFLRESDLLRFWLQRSQRLLYFSTCSVFDESLAVSSYVRHKIKMEELVLSKPSNTIIRLPQVVGRCDNKNTLTNFIAENIYAGRSYDLYCGTLRNLIDISDVVTLAKYLFTGNPKKEIYSFAVPKYYRVERIVEVMEVILNKKSLHRSLLGTPNRYPDSDFVGEAIANKAIKFEEDYLETTLIKYYHDFPKRVS